jgi:hypothetical protein
LGGGNLRENLWKNGIFKYLLKINTNMKLFLLSFLLFPLFVFCQPLVKKIKNPASLDSVVYDISPETLAPSNIKFPFKEIEIIDARFDTSKIGFAFYRQPVDLDYKDFKKIRLKNGIKNALQEFYNNYYKLGLNETGNKLLIVLKKLWIDNLPDRNYFDERHDIIRNSIQDIHVKIEYYLHKNDEYYPLKRLDSIYQLTDENISNPDLKFNRNDLSFFTYTLKSLVEKNDFTMVVENIANKKKYSFHQIDSFNNKRFVIPVLTDSNLKEGMYMTFKEFVNNSPSVTDYEFTKMGVLKVDGNATANRHYWAYYDKKGLHVRESKKVNLWRMGNTFEFFDWGEVYLKKTLLGNLFLAIPSTNGSNSSSAPGYKTRWVDLPRQIDMETGEIY